MVGLAGDRVVQAAAYPLDHLRKRARQLDNVRYLDVSGLSRELGLLLRPREAVQNPDVVWREGD